jgi:hypothetical protein
MTVLQRQALILGVIGAFFILVIFLLGRRGKLSFRFVVGWLAFGLVVIGTGLLIFTVIPVAEVLGLTPAALGLLMSVVIPVGVAVELSVTASRQQEQIRKLAEDVAILNEQLNRTSGGLS